MKIQSKSNSQFAALDDDTAGEGLAIFLSQDSADFQRYYIEVYAKTNSQESLVGSFYTSPPRCTTPGGPQSRQVGAAVCPGAQSWSVLIRGAIANNPPETADITLISSKCCTAPVGVSRVGERYRYDAGGGLGVSSRVMLPGQVVTKVIASARAAGSGVFDLGTGEATIFVEAGHTVVLEPKVRLSAFDFAGGFLELHFNNLDWVIEMTESA